MKLSDFKDDDYSYKIGVSIESKKILEKALKETYGTMKNESIIKGNPKFNGIYSDPKNLIKRPKKAKVNRRTEILRSAIIQAISEDLGKRKFTIISCSEKAFIFAEAGEMPFKVEYDQWTIFGKKLERNWNN